MESALTHIAGLHSFMSFLIWCRVGCWWFHFDVKQKCICKFCKSSDSALMLNAVHVWTNVAPSRLHAAMCVAVLAVDTRCPHVLWLQLTVIVNTCCCCFLWNQRRGLNKNQLLLDSTLSIVLSWAHEWKPVTLFNVCTADKINPSLVGNDRKVWWALSTKLFRQYTVSYWITSGEIRVLQQIP